MWQRLLKAWGARWARSLIIQVAVALLVVPLACVCIFIPLYIVQNNHFDNTTTALILSVSGGGFLALLLGGTAGVAWWITHRRAQQLDAAFVPLGLAGRMHLASGRQYHGQVRGRTVDVYFSRGPTLDVYLGTTVKTRVSLGQQDRVGRALAQMFKREPFTPFDTELAAYTIYGVDEVWTQAVFTQPAVKGAVQRLLEPLGAYEMRQLHLQPEAVWLQLHYTALAHITPENARQWLADMQILAETAEAERPPANPVEASGLERRNRSHRDAYIWPAVGIVLALVCGGSLCGVVPLLIFLALEGR
jgi:hypothetical protein